MKGLHAYKGLFLITLLCLWVPNFCDTDQHDTSSTPDVQVQQLLQSDGSSTQDIPSNKEKNLEETKEEMKIIDNLEENLPPLEIKEEKIVNVENGKIKSINTRDETDIKWKSSVVHTEKPKPNFIVMPNGDVMKPVPPTTAMPPVKPVAEQILQVSSAGSDSGKILESAAPHYDGMPSFDEWKRMMLAQQQQEGQQVASPTPAGKKLNGRKRNYSSYECGAKIVAANQEAEGASRILNELVDDYMLNPCTAKIWFVVELCETVQATQIELANFELFSSCPKSFSVWSSDHFPTRDWLLLGSFTAAEQRVLQGFPLKQEGFGKFIKIELDGHYGKEHYCPLSVVRIFGTSMVDEYEEMETFASHPIAPDDDLDRLDLTSEDKKSTIFGSATDAVLNIVKKAAQALGQHQTLEGAQSNETMQEQNTSKAKQCKLAENSKECTDSPNVILPSDSSFVYTPSWKHRSLFQLLSHCDHCINPRLRYYSSAQPHCRFFQAAFGPVAFKALCDWLREHPLSIAHEIQSNKKNPEADGEKPRTKSRPPQVIQVPMENDTSSLNNSEITLEANESVTPTEMISEPKPSAIVLDEIKLEPSIPQPSVTDVNSSPQNITKNDSPVEMTTYPPTKGSTSEISLKTDVVDSNVTSVDVTEAETLTINGTATDPIPDVFTEAEEEQIKDFMSDAGTLSTEDITLSEMASATDPPRKSSDVHSEGKSEAIVGAPSAGQKESVFMRMSNRIKSLELNMSLSSQYLQELSQRYRKQMDEMQRAFNRTIGTLNDTARKAAEKDMRQQEILNSLQLQMANLTQTVEFLVNERTSALRQMIETHVFLMVVEAIIMVTILSLCVRRLSSTQQPYPKLHVEEVARLSKRRSSVDSTLGSAPPAKKIQRRSVSEENLNKEDELLIIEPTTVLLDSMFKTKKKNRKRNRAVQRSISNPVTSCKSRTSSHASVRRASRSDSCISKNHPFKQPLYNCENCHSSEAIHKEKEKRVNGGPLHNLTNGNVLHAQEPSKKISSRKERFSFKRLLRFQKRDSI